MGSRAFHSLCLRHCCAFNTFRSSLASHLPSPAFMASKPNHPQQQRQQQQGKVSGKQQWKPKPSTGTILHVTRQDVASGSFLQVPASNMSQQIKKPVDSEDVHSITTELEQLKLDPGPGTPGAAHPKSNLKSKRDGHANTSAGAGQEWVVKRAGGANVDRLVEGEEQSRGLHLKKDDVAPSAQKGEVAAHKKVKVSIAQAQIRATFYPKFENEKSDQEVRTRMHEVVSAGLGVLEVSMKHSGSLFLYSGDNGGAFAKNSYGNLYTAVGVYVLTQTLQEAWGQQAGQKQRELNEYLKEHRICIGMELVTAVLGDHGQRPLQDYVVVTAVTNLIGRPHFQSTPDIIAFCHQWRLPTNHYWLFSTRNSVSSFFAAYDALCEEGLARTVTKALNEVAETYLPATKSHEDIQGEILEGLVARIVTPQSLTKLEEVLEQFPRPAPPEAELHGVGLREICSANRESERKQVEALLKAVGSNMCSNWADWMEDGVGEVDSSSKTHLRPMLESFLHSSPADYSTKKLQEMIRVIHKAKLPVRFKCRTNMSGPTRGDQDHILSQFKMAVHVLSDSAFRRYQREMGKHPGLWPLYRGFFVDVFVYNGSGAPAIMNMKSIEDASIEEPRKDGECGQDDSVDESQNLMLKLKFLPYKIRTFLIRNGLKNLFDNGVADYKTYYTRQMKVWGTSPGKQHELNQLLSEWAGYIKKKMKGKKLSNSTYLTEAEPFLKAFAERSPKNQRLVGAAGVQINVDDFLAQVAQEQETEDEFIPDEEQPIAHAPAVKAQGMLVFFPGIPGCAKSAICKEIMASPDGLGSRLAIHSLMGDMTKGKYWPKLNDERVKKPHRITLADKNAPNNDVWKTIQNTCNGTRAIGVPVIPESEGTGVNPFALDVLAVFMYRVLQRTNHPGNLDKNSANPGYVLLMFYNLYDGKDRKDFEEELRNQFGHLVQIPVLKPKRAIPTAVTLVIEEGLDLFKRHTNRHGRLESLYGSFKEEWATWEKQLKEVLCAHSKHLIEVQVPFQEVVSSVQEQLRAIRTGDFNMHVPVVKEERAFNNIKFVAISIPPEQLLEVLQEVTTKYSQLATVLTKKKMKESLSTAHITLAHKLSHGVPALAAYAPLRGTETQVQLTAVLYSEKLIALEVHLIENEERPVESKNEWPHITVWTDTGVPAKEANKLPKLVEDGEATRVDLEPIMLTGTIGFY